MNTTIERIKLISDYEGVTITNLEKTIGASKGVLSRAIAKKTDIQSKWLSLLVDNYPQINPDWLLTGAGSMLRETLSPELSNSGVPLVSVEAAAGFASAGFAIHEKDIIEHYLVPDFKEVDFMLRISGDSMSPTYNGGDVLGCRDIKDSKFIQWGRVYLVSTMYQGLLVKRLQPGKDEKHLSCVSDNIAYGPFEINRSEIHGLALIMGAVRIE